RVAARGPRGRRPSAKGYRGVYRSWRPSEQSVRTRGSHFSPANETTTAGEISHLLSPITPPRLAGGIFCFRGLYRGSRLGGSGEPSPISAAEMSGSRLL